MSRLAFLSGKWVRGWKQSSSAEEWGRIRVKLRKWLAASALVLMLLVSGCSGTKAGEASSSSQSSKQGVIRIPKLPKTGESEKHSSKKEHASKKAASSAKSSASSSSVAARTEAKVLAKARTMNFAEIQKGDFSSLIGDWREVGLWVNHSDGKGTVWDHTHLYSHLKIGSALILSDEASLQNNRLDSEDGVARVKYQVIDGVLTATAILGAREWDVRFAPAHQGKDYDQPGSDPTKEHIEIGHMGDPDYAVFERQAPKAVKQNAGMDLAAIKQGSYSSLNGTWRNALGKTIVVKNQQMQFSDFGYDPKKATPGTVTNFVMNVPSLNDAQGKPKVMVSDRFRLPKYRKQLQVDATAGQATLIGYAPMAQYLIGFFPAGSSTSVGNSSRERIAALVTQNDINSIPVQRVYYKVK